jgi:hypothetical protein
VRYRRHPNVRGDAYVRDGRLVRTAGCYQVSLDTPGGVWKRTKRGAAADTTLILSEQHFEDLLLNHDAFERAVEAGLVKVLGDAEKWAELGQLLATLTSPPSE